MRRKWRNRILGCLLFAAILVAGPTARAEKFTIAVIPDTQNYIDAYAPPAAAQFNREMQFLADNKNALNLKFVSHVGDVWQHGDSYPSEPAAAASAMQILAGTGVPFGVVPGNHDYDNAARRGSAGLDGSTVWNQNFGPNSSFFAGKSWYGGAFVNGTGSSGMTSYQTFSAGKWNFLHVGLPVEPSAADLQYAQNVINSHLGMPTIVTTHEYLGWNNGGDGKAVRLNDNYRTGFDHTSGQQLWDNFLKVNPQIFMALCGHNFNGATNPASRRIDADSAGYNVYQLLSDYQATPDPSGNAWGGGWVRLMEFDTAANAIHVKTYSTHLDKYSTDPSLTDGSAYAKARAPFNYAGSQLVPSSNSGSSDFVLSFNFDQRFAAAPEPASLLLLALASGTLLRRRKEGVRAHRAAAPAARFQDRG